MFFVAGASSTQRPEIKGIIRPVATVPDPFRLHLGGKEAREGWMLYNIQPGDGVDYIGDIRDLSQFADACCDVIYASHVLEHVALAELRPTLEGFRRILKPGARLLISVPDLEILSRLILREDLDTNQKYQVMTMMFGGQTDAHDFHKIGLTLDILGEFLAMAGFERIQRVERFDLFSDISGAELYGGPISLNVIAQK